MLRRLLPALAAFMTLTGFQLSPSHAVRGSGDVGRWELLWSVSEFDGVQNRFREVVGVEREFPVSWRRVTDRSGDRLAFFDRNGDMEETVAIEPHVSAVASNDGTAYLLWTQDPVHREYSSFRFVRRDAEGIAWEATAKGAPALLAPDGSVFVIATREDKMDLIHSGRSETVGSLQVVGASGDIRGEFPIFPFYAHLTGDQRRIVLLHNRELVVLDRDGKLAWNREVSLDQMCNREGVVQLAAAGGVIAVGGTGGREIDRRSLIGIHPVRRGAIEVFDDDGRFLWRDEQSEDSDLWFQMTAAISADGQYLAASYSASREVVVRLYEARTGRLLWSQDTSRRDGCRALSITGHGDMIVLSHGDTRTTVTAWDRAGRVVWDGLVPFPGRAARITDDDLLVSDQWIVQLSPAPSDS